MRPDAEVLAGTLRVQVGPGVRPLPVLNIDDGDAWKDALGRALLVDTEPLTFDTLANLGTAANATFDTVLDLVVAYDRTSALGGREWLRANASHAQVYAIFRRLLEVTFPFADDLRAVATVVLDLITKAQVMATVASAQVGRSPGANSTNGRSPRGASHRAGSARK